METPKKKKKSKKIFEASLKHIKGFHTIAPGVEPRIGGFPKVEIMEKGDAIDTSIITLWRNEHSSLET